MSGQDYEITLPDGRAIVVTAPDEKSARTAANNFLMREKGTKKGKGGGVDNFGRSVASGATFGLADEIAAAGDATVGPALDWVGGKLGLGKTNTSTAPTWSERYNQNLESERGQDKAYAEENPGWDIGGKVLGGVLGAIATLPRFLLQGAGIGRSAATGAGLGAVSGFGEGEGGFEDRALNAAKGGAIGGVLGGAAPVVTGALGTVGNMALETGAGRAVADKAAPVMLRVADMVAPYTSRIGAKSLSAAAPDGGPSPPGMLQSVADRLRSAARSGDEILDDGAIRRIADAAQRGGTDVPGMRARVNELGPGAMLADTDPMVERLGRTTYISPGSAPRVINEAMDARNRATGERMGNAVRQSFGDTNPAVLEVERLRGQRAGQGVQNYREAVGPDAPFTISPQMREIMRDAPVVQEVMDRIEREAAARGITLTPAQVAHRVKRQLAADADAAFANGRAVNKEDVGALGERWRTALHDANPAIREADQAWEAGSRRIDALNLGRQFMRQGTGEIDDAVSPAVLAERIPRMSAEEAQAFLAGAADTLYVKTNSGMRPARQVAGAIDENQNLRHKLVSMLGEERANMLFNRAMAERKFASTDRVIRGGSDTASKMLSAMDDAATGGIPTSPNSILSRIIGKAAEAYNKGRAGNEAVRERIARMLTDTDAVANADTINRIAEVIAAQARKTRGARTVATGAAQIQE